MFNKSFFENEFPTIVEENMKHLGSQLSLKLNLTNGDSINVYSIKPITDYLLLTVYDENGEVNDLIVPYENIYQINFKKESERPSMGFQVSSLH